MDLTKLVTLVDAFTDKDPKTRDTCPGTINGDELIPVFKQFNRRLRLFKKVKNIIYLEAGTHNYWYKSSKCNVAIVAMGFSIKNMANHPKSVPMETYASIFEADPVDYISEIRATAEEWLKRNDFEKI